MSKDKERDELSMLKQKNKLMNSVSLAGIVIAGIVHLLARKFHVFDHTMHAHGMLTSSEMESQYGPTLYILLALPVFLLAVTFAIYARRSDHPIIPYLHTLILTLGSNILNPLSKFRMQPTS
ncbi:hypothetical protein J14TS5_08790 [Paenibacillus lautus]|nr:hypothetical protein J14TS5_08790 [Paenibacillus lautus]